MKYNEQLRQMDPRGPCSGESIGFKRCQSKQRFSRIASSRRCRIVHDKEEFTGQMFIENRDRSLQAFYSQVDFRRDRRKMQNLSLRWMFGQRESISLGNGVSSSLHRWS